MQLFPKSMTFGRRKFQVWPLIYIQSSPVTVSTDTATLRENAAYTIELVKPSQSLNTELNIFQGKILKEKKRP